MSFIEYNFSLLIFKLLSKYMILLPQTKHERELKKFYDGTSILFNNKI